MGAFELMKELRGAGVIVHADGGTLDISPADRLTDETIEALKRHKPEILGLLETEGGQLVGNAEQLRPPDKIINHPQAVGGWKPDPCNRCIHISRFAGGNACRTNNGLALLFGMLYNVPEDQGAACASWQADRWETLRPTEWMH